MVNKLRKEKRERPTVEELYAALKSSLATFVRTFLVFDALDECDRESQRESLLPLFQCMGRGGFQLFITSRQYPEDIQSALQLATKIELSAQREDIRAYIERRLAANTRAKIHVEKAKCKTEIDCVTTEKAGGM